MQFEFSPGNPCVILKNLNSQYVNLLMNDDDEITLLSARCTPELVEWATDTTAAAYDRVFNRLGLDGRERERVLRHRYPVDRLRTIIGRVLACVYFNQQQERQQQLLYLPTAAATDMRLLFSRDSNDRPILIEPVRFDNFSISHHGDWVVFAGCRSTDQRVGIDVVDITERPLDIVDSGDDESYFNLMAGVFTEQEFLSIMREAVGQARWNRFYRLWAIKESYVKAMGQGMAIELQSVKVDQQNHANSQWSYQTAMLDERHLVAMSVISPNCHQFHQSPMQFTEIDPADMLSD